MSNQKDPVAPLIRVYDFFSGCGGTSVGFGQAGINHALAVDSNPDAVHTFKKNFPGIPVIEDQIEGISPMRIQAYYESKEEVKLFCGCVPCQPFTKQKTNSAKQVSFDKRRGLLKYFSDIVHACLPELVFFENVPGIQMVSLEDRSPFASFVDQLKADAYSVAFDVIAAQDFGGAQVRRRLILVASRLGEISLPKPTYGHKKAKPYVTVRDAIGDLPPVRHGTEHPDKKNYPNHRAAALSQLNLERIRRTSDNGRRDWPDWLLPNCYAVKKDGKQYNGHSDCYTRLPWDEPAPGLTTRCISYSNGRFGHPEQDRAITVREAARLQGFPDDFIFTGSLNSMARQIGNAVSVPVARVLGIHFVNHTRKTLQHHG